MRRAPTVRVADTLAKLGELEHIWFAAKTPTQITRWTFRLRKRFPARHYVSRSEAGGVRVFRLTDKYDPFA